MSVNLPLWRSMLFVPANVDRFVKKAHERDADAIILDLEDSVPLAEKATARLRIGSAAQLVARGGADVIVRINSSLRLAAADLETAVDARVAAICIPKVSSAEQLQWISEAIDQLEIEKQLPLGHTRLIALVESVAALPKLIEIASSTSRLAGLIVGSEDLSDELQEAIKKADVPTLSYHGEEGYVGEINNYYDTILEGKAEAVPE